MSPRNLSTSQQYRKRDQGLSFCCHPVCGNQESNYGLLGDRQFPGESVIIGSLDGFTLHNLRWQCQWHQKTHALLVHNHANILTTWIHLTYIALQGHQACLQSWPFWEAFEYKFVLEDAKEKSHNKLHEQFWPVLCQLFLVSVWVTLLWMEGLVLDHRKCGPKYATKYNLLCQYYGPFPESPLHHFSQLHFHASSSWLQSLIAINIGQFPNLASTFSQTSSKSAHFWWGFMANAGFLFDCLFTEKGNKVYRTNLGSVHSAAVNPWAYSHG